jgi:hypothetical protein
MVTVGLEVSRQIQPIVGLHRSPDDLFFLVGFQKLQSEVTYSI